jgi:hypothetical protein
MAFHGNNLFEPTCFLNATKYLVGAQMPIIKSRNDLFSKSKDEDTSSTKSDIDVKHKGLEPSPQGELINLDNSLQTQ